MLSKRCHMDLINKFEYETNNTIKEFNDIFIGSPILELDNSIKVEIGELTSNGFRKLYLETGKVIENQLDYRYNHADEGKKIKYIYIINDQKFKSIRDIRGTYPLASQLMITRSIDDPNFTIKHYGGLKVKRMIKK